VTDKAVSVAVVGVSGYTGAELVRLLLEHPRVEITGTYAKRAAGEPLASVFPQFAGRLERLVEPFDADVVAARARVVFSALPHGESAKVVRALYERGLVVIDLSADLRLKDPAVYREWYGEPADPLAAEAVYGLPELSRTGWRDVRLVAVPGCYPTAALLALTPLVDAGLVERQGIIVDAKSGVSGAGRTPSAGYHFPELAEGVRAYKVAGTHRHAPEIEQGLGVAAVAFTPHLVPMSRGMLAVCYARPTDRTRPPDAYRGALGRAYQGAAFVSVVDHPPDTAHVRGSNRAHVFVAFDARADVVVAMCAIDNLGKGAAGQAVQCMNRILGFDETLGLGGVGVFP
jgi:N-acetyl-gamma-glutamyl-phosphate reductase